MFVGKVICVHCDQSNMDTAIKCEHCGKILHETMTVSDSFREELRLRIAEIQAKNPTTVTVSIVDDNSDHTMSARQMPRVTRAQDVVLIEQEVGMEYHISHDCADMILVGRFPDEKSNKQINLSQVSGRSGGVSRLHASFTWDNHTLQIIDHNSKNGTYVNNKRLAPEQAVDLHHKDIVSFGYVSFLAKYE